MNRRIGYAHVVKLREEYVSGKRSPGCRRGVGRHTMEERWRRGVVGCICSDERVPMYDGHQWELEHLAHKYGVYPNTIHWLMASKESLRKRMFKQLCRLVHWHEQLLGRGLELKEILTISTELERQAYWQDYWYHFYKRRGDLVPYYEEEDYAIHQVRAGHQDVDEE